MQEENKINCCNNCVYANFLEGMCGKTYFNLCNPNNDCKYFKIEKNIKMKIDNKYLISVLKQLRDYALEDLDIDWDEYEAGCKDTEYTRELTLIQETLDKYEEKV